MARLVALLELIAIHKGQTLLQQGLVHWCGIAGVKHLGHGAGMEIGGLHRGCHRGSEPAGCFATTSMTTRSPLMTGQFHQGLIGEGEHLTRRCPN